MSQTELDPVQGACRHLRSRFKLQPSRKSPFPERRFIRYECEMGHEIDGANEELIQKCMEQQVGCWQEKQA